jgi:hypothetical protein
MQLITLVGGWWSVTGLFLTPVVLVMNTYQIIRSRSLREVSPARRGPTLTPILAEQLEKFRTRMISMLQEGHHPAMIAQHFASLTGLSDDQIMIYLNAQLRKLDEQNGLQKRLRDMRDQ